MSIQKIFQDGTLVDVNVRMWGGQKQLQPQDLGLRQEDLPESFQLGKKRLVPLDIIAQLKHQDYRARRVLMQHSLPFPFGSARFVPKTRFMDFAKEFDKVKTGFHKMVKDLLENYETYRLQMRKEYTQAANKAHQRLSSIKGYDVPKDKFIRIFLQRIDQHYPSVNEIARKFSMEFVVFQMALPDITQATYEEVAEEGEKLSLMKEAYQEYLKDKIAQTVHDFVAHPRNDLLHYLRTFKAAIDNKKRVTEKSLRYIREAFERYEKMDLTGDQGLRQAIAGFKVRCLDHTTAKMVRESEKVQESISDELSIIIPIIADEEVIRKLTEEYRQRVGV